MLCYLFTSLPIDVRERIEVDVPGKVKVGLAQHVTPSRQEAKFHVLRVRLDLEPRKRRDHPVKVTNTTATWRPVRQPLREHDRVPAVAAVNLDLALEPDLTVRRHAVQPGPDGDECEVSGGEVAEVVRARVGREGWAGGEDEGRVGGGEGAAVDADERRDALEPLLAVDGDSVAAVVVDGQFESGSLIRCPMGS